MTHDASKAIEELNRIIDKTQEQITLVKSIDFSKPVTENQWHIICETPLRYSDSLAIVVRNTFPLAENIEVNYLYVCFDMMGFKVQIPTSPCRGINVSTAWYRKDCGEPELRYTTAIEDLIKYYDAVDNKKGWYECAKYRIRYGESCKKWQLFIAWWFKYKWKKTNRKQFEKVKAKEEQTHKKWVESYYSERKEMKNKSKKLLNELLPILDKFSTEHFHYNAAHDYSIEEIREWEGL